MAPADRSLTVAAAQVVALPLSGADEALNAARRLVAQASRQGADLVVLPECTYPAYCIGLVDAYRRAAKMAPDAYIGELRELARRFRLHIVSGFVEDSGTSLANAAVLIDPEGRELGRHRKTFLWNRDNDWFAPGDRIEAFDSPLGRIGIIICAEARCPEVAATLVARGAELLAMPTCWFNTAREPGQYTNPQVEYVIQARAREFGVPFVCADKSGNDGEDPGYCGHSLIIDRDGSRLAEAPGTGEALIVSRIALRTATTPPIPREQRERILSADAPVRPPADARPVTVAVVPGRIVGERLRDRADESLLEKMQAQGVKILATRLPREISAEKLASAARAFGIDAIGQASSSNIREVGREAGVVGFHAACLPGEALHSFAPARAAMLQGAAALLVLDGCRDLTFLRTRALENRMYVIAAAEDWAAIIGPDGSVVAMTDAGRVEPIVATIDPSLTADKRMAPRTDICEQRRVGAFRL